MTREGYGQEDGPGESMFFPKQTPAGLALCSCIAGLVETRWPMVVEAEGGSVAAVLGADSPGTTRPDDADRRVWRARLGRGLDIPRP